MKNLIVVILLSLVIAACQTKPDKEELEEIKQTEQFDEQSKVIAERFASMYETIPSSELAGYLESVDAEYNGAFINDPGQASAYLISHEQAALATGVYYMDMMYVAAYRKRDQVGQLYDALTVLTDSIGVGRVFNQAVLEQFSEELEENPEAKKHVKDALVEASKNLNTNDRIRISTLIMAGIVIERLHLLKSIIDQAVANETLDKQDVDLMISPLMQAVAQQRENVNSLVEAVNLVRTPDDDAEGFTLLYELQHEYDRLQETAKDIDFTQSVDPSVLSGIFEVVADLRQNLVTPGK